MFLIGMSVFITCMVITAIITDITTYIIPNLLVIIILLCYPIIVLMAHVTAHPMPDWQMGLLFGAGTFLVGFVLFAIKAMGGGDVKLLAVIALYAGKSAFLPFIVTTAILGGVLSIFLLITRPIALYVYGRLGKTPADIPRILSSGAPVPYGVAIGFSFIFLIWTGEIAGIAL